MLTTKEPKDIASLMGLSDKLATLNFDRYQSWSAAKKTSADSQPALFVFQGDVYQGLQADTFNKKDITFAQKHLRILSGLYGELRPLDVIKPYRLEKGTKLKISYFIILLRLEVLARHKGQIKFANAFVQK
jgi:hypothetical protein